MVKVNANTMLTAIRKGRAKRKPTKFNKCMSRKLSGKMKGKSAVARKAAFKKAAKECGKSR